MATHVTTSLTEQLTELGEDAAEFAGVFDAWKRRCSVNPDAEFESKLFGKDGAYASPKVGGEKYLLRHVHLLPIKELEKIPRWLAILKNKGRKTSNRVLVYTSASPSEHLLLFILDEPDAHKVAEMHTTEDKQLMHQFAAVAEAFLHDRSIVA